MIDVHKLSKIAAAAPIFATESEVGLESIERNRRYLNLHDDVLRRVGKSCWRQEINISLSGIVRDAAVVSELGDRRQQEHESIRVITELPLTNATRTEEDRDVFQAESVRAGEARAAINEWIKAIG